MEVKVPGKAEEEFRKALEEFIQRHDVHFRKSANRTI